MRHDDGMKTLFIDPHASRGAHGPRLVSVRIRAFDDARARQAVVVARDCVPPGYLLITEVIAAVSKGRRRYVALWLKRGAGGAPYRVPTWRKMFAPAWAASLGPEDPRSSTRTDARQPASTPSAKS